nr:tetratricopeptide repeat protein [Gemmatimonadaceae bacterium]
MPDVAKLKKKAAELELKKQFDKALAVYVEVLDSYDASDEDVDVGLYNRVGDLYLKQGNVADAVDYYEQAVERYAEGGFFNNAIALCNKILRSAPGRATVYYKLGRISAQKGFKSDAKANFLEYADRMQQAGKFDEAFRALKEFADLCPDQDDIRLMLADQLSKKNRGPEAIEQLQLLYERYSHEGRSIEARATIDRMKAIDPNAEPNQVGSAPRRADGDLVFLDLSDTAAKRQSVVAKRATLGLEILDTGEHPEIVRPAPSPAAAAAPAPTPELLDTPVIEPALLDGVNRAAEFERASETTDGGLLDGFETMSFGSPPPATPSGSLLDLEPTSLAMPAPSRPAPPVRTPPPSDIDSLDLDSLDLGATPTPAAPPARPARPSLTDLPMLVDDRDEEPLDVTGSVGGELEFLLPDAPPAKAPPPSAPTRAATASEPELDDLPLMDFELPSAGEAEAAIAAAGAADAGAAGETIDFDADDEPAEESDVSSATPAPARRSSTMMAERSVELLQALTETDPEDHTLRRRLAEAMLESGDREGGLRELEAAMIGFERADDLTRAAKVADEIILINPDSVRHHQKRVEYAFRTNESGRLVEAYLQLADALFRAGQVEKSRAIYQRVLDLAPDDVRAASALEGFPEAPPEPPKEAPKGRSTIAIPRASIGVAAAAATPPRPLSPVPDDDEFINLGDWLRDDEVAKDTRMVVEEQDPTGDEAADFQDMLKKFKQGISENVEEEDHQSHYDLGVAY